MTDSLDVHGHDTPDLRFNIEPLILVVRKYDGTDPKELIELIKTHPLNAKVLDHVLIYANDPRFKETYETFLINTLDNLSVYPIFTEAFRLTYQLFRSNKDLFVDKNLQGVNKDWSEYTDEDIVKRNTEVFYSMYYKFHLYFEKLLKDEDNCLQIPADFDLNKLKFLISVIVKFSENPNSRFHGIQQVPSFSGALLSALVDYAMVSLNLVREGRFSLGNLEAEYMSSIANIIYKEYVFLPSRKLSITQINHSRPDNIANRSFIKTKPLREGSPALRDVLVYKGDDLPHAAILGCIASYAGGIYFSIEDYLESIKMMANLRSDAIKNLKA